LTPRVGENNAATGWRAIGALVWVIRPRRAAAHHGLRDPIGLDLRRIAGLADLPLLLDPGPASLLHRVHELVGDQELPLAAARLVLARAEMDVIAGRERAGAEGRGRLRRRIPGVHPRIAELRSGSVFDPRSNARVDRRSAAVGDGLQRGVRGRGRNTGRLALDHAGGLAVRLLDQRLLPRYA
jgi:hypothetical protein